MVNTDYDSILTAQDTNFINTSQYYKVGKGMPDQGIPVVERPYVAGKDDVVIGVTVFMVLLLGIMFYRGRTTILYRLKDFFATRRTYSQENAVSGNHDAYSAFVLTTVSALSLSVLVFDYIGMNYGFERVLGIPYWLFAGGYVLFMTFVYVKAWMYQLVNWTFFDRDSSSKWMSGYLLLTSISAYLVLPLSLVALLVEESHWIVKCCFIFVLIVYELLLFFRMFVNFGSKKYGYLLIFLYFCSVELMSAVVMSRIIQWTIDYIIVKILN